MGGYALIQAFDEESGALQKEMVINRAFSTSPTMGFDGTLYLSASNTLSAYRSGSPGPANSPWRMQAQNPRRTWSQAGGLFPLMGSIVSNRMEFSIGQNLELQGVAHGPPPIDVAWELNGAPMPNETNLVLKIGPAQFNSAGLYRLRVSNASGTILSDPANVVPAGTP